MDRPRWFSAVWASIRQKDDRTDHKRLASSESRNTNLQHPTNGFLPNGHRVQESKSPPRIEIARDGMTNSLLDVVAQGVSSLQSVSTPHTSFEGIHILGIYRGNRQDSIHHLRHHTYQTQSMTPMPMPAASHSPNEDMRLAWMKEHKQFKIIKKVSGRIRRA
ncbi:hypothetical protein PAXRUDRAFT_546067 [Paxillus rubicundulus Ve08.2h10]|uniref:Uncharacterized protein n=1 Tax=Paxillus rubicundulus Ve08.2h10 TaxID=930991 RepID=A0A0D0E023_9AGAM|nr:hypothetical protein PAXRUDRAFT_546067 [Paxillus rubicundulus Ve08.2h10]